MVLTLGCHCSKVVVYDTAWLLNMLMKERQMVDPKPVLSCWLICCWYLTMKKVPAAVKHTMQGHMTINNSPCSVAKSSVCRATVQMTHHSQQEEFACCRVSRENWM